MAAKRLECILVLEDDRAIRDVLVTILRKAGHDHVVTAGNAEEALFYVFKDAGLHVKLAIVDLMLPNASGLAFIRKVREAKASWRRNMRVIVLTGRTDTETYNMAAKRGIQAYLMKPISPSLLTETVDKVLNPPPPQEEALATQAETQEQQEEEQSRSGDRKEPAAPRGTRYSIKS